jgi:hypothetical protein
MFSFAQKAQTFVIQNFEPIVIKSLPTNLNLIDTLNSQIKFLKVNPALGGLKPSYPITMSYELSAFSEVLSIGSEYLAIYNYFAYIDNEIIEINTPEKFLKIFGPVEDKEEAFSFAVALNVEPSAEIMYNLDFLRNHEDNFIISRFEVATPSISEVENGYKITFIKREGTLEYFEESYFVSKKGEVKLLNRELVFKDKNWMIFN